jgi:agmatine deiminase
MYTRPAEWRKDKVIWLAWPFDQALWGEDLAGAQKEFIALVSALKNEHVVVLCPNSEELKLLSAHIDEHDNLSLKIVPYGDIWLRDTLPIFVKDERGRTVAMIPKFNGWGKKYLFNNDEDLSTRVADLLLCPKIYSRVVFEGGAIESDGAGTFLTTEQCLLNINRNPSLNKKAIEEDWQAHLGAQKVIWLKEGLKNDHTDGHIDTLVRFIGPQKITIMHPNFKDEPNYTVLRAIKEQLSKETDAYDHHFELVELPSPGIVLNRHGDLMPASFLNFIIGDHTAIIPLYGTSYDNEAVKILSSALRLKVVGLSAKAILTGGGAFHCISQEYYR